MPFDFTQRKALVCGASQGIGRAVSHLLASGGAQVTVVARREDVLQSLIQELPGEGHDFIAVDLSDTEELKNILTIKDMDYDILVCNAGGPPAGPISTAHEEDYLTAFKTHVIANSILFQAVFPHMKQNEFGRVINIISTSVKAPIPNLGVSNTIRAAVASWAKTLSLEVGEYNITVNNVLPGYTETPRLEALLKKASERSGESVEETASSWKGKVPLKRFASAEEVAHGVVFLASQQAGYISGINLPVDGGRTASL
ncbi:MAG: SDR family oxidoreductase [Bdellovibrionales bacterium]|nr:SDR family oxidoreductase [Bdellovibrionales bacterium]MCB0413864.1 SDR family oxidoreductase [Bdellovibrionales bacterium]